MDDNMEKIYEEYFLGVYKFVLKMCSNPQVAEEIAQETFYKAMLNIHKFQGNCKLYVWLCQIAKNEYLNYVNKRENKNVSLDKASNHGKLDCFDKIFEDEQVKEIYKALHKIDEPFKEVFLLRVFAQLPFAEIGALFDKSDNWARVAFFRAKKKITREMEEQDNEV